MDDTELVIGLVVGGCAYRNYVHTAHATSIAELCSAAVSSEKVSSIRFSYNHTSNLPQGRCLWLRDAIDRAEFDFAVSIDSDTAFNGHSLLRQIYNLEGDRAIGIAPVIRKTSNGISLNIYSSPGEPLAISACGGGHPSLWAGGFGLAVFNLKWFREFWPEPTPCPFGHPDDWINQGEDIQMCRAVVAQGGTVVPLWIPTTHYDSSSSVIGGRLSYHNGRMTVIE